MKCDHAQFVSNVERYSKVIVKEILIASIFSVHVRWFCFNSLTEFA